VFMFWPEWKSLAVSFHELRPLAPMTGIMRRMPNTKVIPMFDLPENATKYALFFRFMNVIG